MTHEPTYGRDYDYVGRTDDGTDLGTWHGGDDVEALGYFAATFISNEVRQVMVYRLSKDSEAYVGTANRTTGA